jgi:hypothetical protein
LNELLCSAENRRSLVAEAILARKTRCTGISQWKPEQGAAELDPAEGEGAASGSEIDWTAAAQRVAGEASLAMKQGGADGGEASTSSALHPRLLGRA